MPYPVVHSARGEPDEQRANQHPENPGPRYTYYRDLRSGAARSRGQQGDLHKKSSYRRCAEGRKYAFFPELVLKTRRSVAPGQERADQAQYYQVNPWGKRGRPRLQAFANALEKLVPGQPERHKEDTRQRVFLLTEPAEGAYEQKHDRGQPGEDKTGNNYPANSR
jgi:hypothetical protein